MDLFILNEAFASFSMQRYELESHLGKCMTSWHADRQQNGLSVSLAHAAASTVKWHICFAVFLCHQKS